MGDGYVQRNSPPDPRTDNGVVERPATPAEGSRKSRRKNKHASEPVAAKDATDKDAKDDKIGVVGWLTLALLGGLVALAVFVVVPWLEKHDLMPQGTTANGEGCSVDSDCKSGDCYKKTCRGEAIKVRGDRCERDADCKSKRCSSRVCD